MTYPVSYSKKIHKKSECHPKKIFLREITMNDFHILYYMLKKFLSIKYANVHENSVPTYKESLKFIEKYLKDNENHEFSKWYMIIDDVDNILGTTHLTKKNYIVTYILKQYRNQGIATKAERILIKKNQRKRYFALVHVNHKVSLKQTKKMGFKPKALLFEKKLY